MQFPQMRFDNWDYTLLKPKYEETFKEPKRSFQKSILLCSPLVPGKFYLQWNSLAISGYLQFDSNYLPNLQALLWKAKENCLYMSNQTIINETTL